AIPAAPVDMPAALVADAAARAIVVDTDTVRAVFSTRGAVLTNWRLKQYKGSDGNPLDLVPAELPAAEARPFALKTGDAALDSVLANALFKPTADAITVARETASLGFEYRDAAGLTARKTFVFNANGHPYTFDAAASLDRAGTKTPFQFALGASLGDGYTTGGSTYYYPPAALYSDGSSVERLDAGDIAEQPRYQGALRWAGVADHYFLFALVGQGQPLGVTYTPVSLPVPGDTGGLVRTFVSWTADASDSTPVRAFFGPKDFDTLKSADISMVRAIDFGIFAWLVVPLLTALKWVNKYIHNYGWSIIVLTLLINAVMAPLRHKSLVSMRKLQTLQPEVKAIQKRYEKYKVTDPERQKMNTEMMTLYRERGVNPASGCVPMLLTMPVLFAFYAMLSVAIELRGAPFVGWIQDLAAHDPLYITPILMGGTMFWQQYITPSTADAVQQKMMLIMPVVFLVMFLWAPAGLVLYWLFSNLWAIGQQLLTNRFVAPVPAGPAQPPAVRRVKRSKGGTA
ncbi:MAG: membrane protein insertase YidC, partial [Acidobacteriota bacterium]|nr:membrane protein insertase YidC [Acidobacteriota bacterium]